MEKLGVVSGSPNPNDFTMKLYGTSGTLLDTAAGQLDSEGRIGFTFTHLSLSSKVFSDAVLFQGNELFSIRLVPAASPIPPLVVQGFTASPAKAVVGQTVTFTAQVSGGVKYYTYRWQFNNFDPTIVTTTSNPMTHVYNSPGVYLVTLTVIDAVGQQQTVQQLYNVN